jgi:DNA-binding NtrC family response regulator
LSVIQIDIPPLRERGDDVLLLAQSYMNSLGSRMRSRVKSLSPEAAEAFRRYQWPGNVRELRNVIERAMILEESNSITIKYLPRNLTLDAGTSNESEIATTRSTGNGAIQLPPGGVSLDEIETSLVRQAMVQSGGNQTRAAELLGISRDQLRYRLKKIEGESADSAP